MVTDTPPILDGDRFAAIVASSSDAIVSKSLDGIVQSWNPAAERLFGWSAQDMIGQSIRRVIPADRQDEEDTILARVRAGELVPKFATIRLARDGELIPIAVTVSPIRDATGKIVGASKIANDLRDQDDLRAGLQQKTAQFTALANNIPQLAWLADASGWVFWYNQRWFDFTGTTLEDMEGWGWRKVHHPDHVDRVARRIQQAWDSGEPWEDLFPLRRKDGTFRWFLSRANPLKNADGDVILWCGTNTDVTDQRAATERITLLMQEVNHRARNMLATIQAMINRSSGLSRDDLTTSLKRRIRALAANQELLNGGDWSGARVRDIVAMQILHLADSENGQIHLSGPSDLVLKPQPAEALGLAIHELATNAERYGALSSSAGKVRVQWQVEDIDAEPTFTITWEETGGPRIEPPAHTGFGTILMKRNMELAFGGAIRLDYRPEGLVWRARGAADRILIDEVSPVELFEFSGLRSNARTTAIDLSGDPSSPR